MIKQSLINVHTFIKKMRMKNLIVLFKPLKTPNNFDSYKLHQDNVQLD